MYYKAMFNLGGRYYSAMASHLSNDAVVEYKLNEMAISPYGPIMAFDTIQRAYEFKRSLGVHVDRHVIAAVEGELWKDINPEYLLALNQGRNYNGKEIEEFWNIRETWVRQSSELRRIPDKEYFNTFAYGNIPEGTLYCSWIKPIEILSES